jgi:two-component system, sensor histidine kinase PdtaS
MALVASSRAPILLLGEDLTIISASISFGEAFDIDPAKVSGTSLADLGAGEWNVPQLASLLRATFAGAAEINSYEMDLDRPGHKRTNLVLNAHKLEYCEGDDPRVMLTVTDVTSARIAERLKDDLVQEKEVLLQEIQHRVANSLQIIASVLMQSAQRVQSEETRAHLRSAHNRVMSIATLQKQLAITSSHEVELRRYLKELCSSIGASMIDDPQRLRLTATVDDSVVDADASVSLGLIVTELVINALKHAFPDRDQPGEIEVGYQSNGPGWELSVSDNGVGMNSDTDTYGPGLGTGIIEALAKHLEAKIEVRDNAPGTRVSVVHAE